MKTFEVQQFGSPQQMKLLELPDPRPHPGQVVINVKTAGVNFADVMTVAGKYLVNLNPPLRPGYEVAGIRGEISEAVICRHLMAELVM